MAAAERQRTAAGVGLFSLRPSGASVGREKRGFLDISCMSGILGEDMLCEQAYVVVSGDTLTLTFNFTAVEMQNIVQTYVYKA